MGRGWGAERGPRDLGRVPTEWRAYASSLSSHLRNRLTGQDRPSETEITDRPLWAVRWPLHLGPLADGLPPYRTRQRRSSLGTQTVTRACG